MANHSSPMVKLNFNSRYYKKSDINREKNGLIEDRLFNSISEFEVFGSDHKDIIFVESIISLCRIYTYDEYESLPEHTNTTFFTRAYYDPVKVKKFNFSNYLNHFMKIGKKIVFVKHHSIQINYILNAINARSGFIPHVAV